MKAKKTLGIILGGGLGIAIIIILYFYSGGYVLFLGPLLLLPILFFAVVGSFLSKFFPDVSEKKVSLILFLSIIFLAILPFSLNKLLFYQAEKKLEKVPIYPEAYNVVREIEKGKITYYLDNKIQLQEIMQFYKNKYEFYYVLGETSNDISIRIIKEENIHLDIICESKEFPIPWEMDKSCDKYEDSKIKVSINISLL